MGIKAIFIDTDHAYRDIRTVIRDALIICDHILKDQSKLDRTLAFAQPTNVSLFQLNIQTVDYLLKRLDLSCLIQIPQRERFHRLIHNITECIGKHLQFFYRFLRKLQFLLMHLRRGIREVDRMIRDALKVTDTVKQNGQGPAVFLRQITVV